jgi:hypothetical protein
MCDIINRSITSTTAKCVSTLLVHLRRPRENRPSLASSIMYLGCTSNDNLLFTPNLYGNHRNSHIIPSVLDIGVDVCRSSGSVGSLYARAV